MKRRRRTYNHRFTEKMHSRRGVVSLILAALAILSGICLILVSFKHAGNGTVYLGSGGVLAMLTAAAALVLGIQSLLEDNSYKTIPVTATIVSALAFGGWAVIYIMGILAA